MTEDGRGYAYGAPKKKYKLPTPKPRPRGALINNSNEFFADNVDLTAFGQQVRDAQALGIDPASDDDWRIHNQLKAATPTVPTPTGQGGGGSGGGGMSAQQRAAYLNAAKAYLQMQSRDPYAQLEAAMRGGEQQAQQKGADAVAALRSAVGAMQNPYANVSFSTPTVAANPLAAYMAASGAGTDQIEGLRSMLGEWSKAATSADQTMADRLRLAGDADKASRMSDIDFTEAGFKQLLAQQLANSQGQLAAQRQQYSNEQFEKLIQLSVQSGIPLAELGVVV